MPRLCSSLLLASSAPAVTMNWSFVGNPGNACDPQSGGYGSGPAGCFGAVGYDYYIGTYEVTVAQYTQFLNSVAATDPNGPYHATMDRITKGRSRARESPGVTPTPSSQDARIFRSPRCRTTTGCALRIG